MECLFGVAFLIFFFFLLDFPRIGSIRFLVHIYDCIVIMHSSLYRQKEEGATEDEMVR